MEKIYEYKKKLVRGSPYTLLADAPIAWVESYIPRKEFALLFGGHLLASDTESSAVCRYKGVWARDKVRRFKQILRERGAIFEVCRIDGDARWISCTAVGPGS